MGIAWDDGGYSSDVAIHLIVDDRIYPVAQICEDTLILRGGAAVPNGAAQLVIIVDGQKQVHHVIIYASALEPSELCYA